jgi:pSer/pThr/pTyr-binding forkhead associated (FHA) protein
MEDDRTVIRHLPNAGLPEQDSDRTVFVRPDSIAVTLQKLDGQTLASYSFDKSFTVGRATDNAVIVNHSAVSRHHMKFKLINGEWWAVDLNSSHGVYINDQKIEHELKLELPAFIRIGISEFVLKIEAKYSQPDAVKLSKNPLHTELFSELNSPQIAKTSRNLSDTELKSRLLSEYEAEDMGDYTRMVRRVIREDRKQTTKNYKHVTWLISVLLLISAGLATYQHFALNNARALAINMFYDIKTMEVSLSQADIRLEESADALELTLKEVKDEKLRISQERILAEQKKIKEEQQRLTAERQKLKSMKAKYEDYLKEVNFLRVRFPTNEQYERELITRVAKDFGESELEVPEEFIKEVKKYIHYWQNSSRMQRAIKTLEDNQYTPTILDALNKAGLPAYFMYLPLQESNYETTAIGPETRFGIAKGAWQFLASTGQEYGLAPGPLAQTREYDEQDKRFDFALATKAGAKYLKYIYSTQAQASGLLVMASYNYGHNRVRQMVEKMPDNPRDKNFWKFIQQYQIPTETYDYVFYIVAAAVIGEDPKHFGFNFKPPLLGQAQSSY